jgi:hypothetical protein
VPEDDCVNADRRLIEAIRAKDARRVRAAITAGAKLEGEEGTKSALHLAAEVGTTEVIEALPRAMIRKVLEESDATGRTPLMYAAAKGNVDTARALLAMGAKVNARNAFGDTALRVAASDGTPDIAKLLLAAGGDPLMPGRMRLTPLDRARERHTPEGRMIAALFIRAQEAKSPKMRQNRLKMAAGRRKSKPARRRRRIGVK